MKYMRWVICVSLFAVFVSCSSYVEEDKDKDKGNKPQERVVSRDEVMMELPCFRCHSYDRFSPLGRGVFPHVIHRDVGYHCNQCHPVTGHHPMKIDTTLCNDCHKLKTFIFAASGFPAQFNHEFHGKLGCQGCHLGIFPMKKGATKMTMDDIYQGRFCGECHNGKKAFPSSECAKCHTTKKFEKQLLYKVAGVGDVVFSHKFHTSVFTCTDCHTKFFAMKKTQGKMSMDAMNKGKFCGGCHNGSVAADLSDCKKCHKP